MKLTPGHWYKFRDRGEIHIGYYLGGQRAFECCVCGEGVNAHTFNIWSSVSGYETWGYGSEHLPDMLEDMGERCGLIENEKEEVTMATLF